MLGRRRELGTGEAQCKWGSGGRWWGRLAGYWGLVGMGLCSLSGAWAEAGEVAGGELPEIQVTAAPLWDGSSAAGYRQGKGQWGLLGEGEKQDTPFSLYGVSADLIANTQAANTTEALKYVPTVYANTGNSQITPYFTLRGFSASTWTFNMAVDGMRSFDIYQPLEDKERIEVLPGNTAFLYGVTSPAGMINYVLKRPTASPLAQVTVGSYDQQLVSQLELGGALGSGEGAYRLTVLYGDKGEANIAHQTQERSLVSGALDWRLSPDTRLSLDLSWSQRDLEYAQPLFMTTAAIGLPQAPDSHKNWGAPYTYAKDSTGRLGAQISSRLNDNLTLRALWRHTDITRDFQNNRIVFTNPALKYKWRLDAQHYDVTVDQYGAFLDGHFHLGATTHDMTLGVTQDDFDQGKNNARSQTFSTVYPATLYGSPTYPPDVQPAQGNATAEQTTYQTLILADRIGLGERWSLLLGGNQARVNDRSQVTPGAGGAATATQYDQSRFVPALALSYKPFAQLTTYATYTEGLQQGGTAPATAVNGGQVFAPFVAKQQEVGAKANWTAVEASLAWFHIEQPNQYVVNNVYSQNGQEIHKGWELALTGRVTERLTLVGGYTVLDATVRKSSTAGVSGKTPQGVPERMGKLYAEYDLPAVPGLSLTGGVSYTGRTWWDATNTLAVPAVTVVDGGLRYQRRLYGKEAVFRVGVSNLTGKDYWTTRSGILYLGAPRTLSLSATLAF